MQAKLSPRVLGVIFLVPSLILGVPSLLNGTFSGGMMGFCTFAVPFGLVMLLMPFPKQDP